MHLKTNSIRCKDLTVHEGKENRMRDILEVETAEGLSNTLWYILQLGFFPLAELQTTLTF